MGIQERKEREKEQRRNLILDAAEKVFFSKGFDLATMDEIAEEAELSKGTLYLYFNNKEELYISINIRGLSILSDMLAEVAEEDGNGLSIVRRMGETYFRFAMEYQDYFGALVSYEGRKIDVEIDNQIVLECEQKGDETLSHIIQAIERGIQDGSIKPAYRSEVLAIILWRTAMGLIQMYHSKHEFLEHKKGTKFEEIIESYFELTMQAISQ